MISVTVNSIWVSVSKITWTGVSLISEQRAGNVKAGMELDLECVQNTSNILFRNICSSNLFVAWEHATLDSLETYQYHTCICDVVMHVFNKCAEIQNNSTLTCVMILKNLVYPCIYSNIWILLATLKRMATFNLYTYIFTNKKYFLWVKSGRNSLLR